MSQLFSPFKLRNLKFKNRVWVSPMCQYSSEDGMPNDWHLVHLGSRAVGGAGLIMVEATAVLPEGRISPKDSGLWSDDHAQAFSRITDFLLKQGAIPGIQLAHAGRKASTDLPWKGGQPIPVTVSDGWLPLAPSALAFETTATIPQPMSQRDIETALNAFVAATHRAIKAGFQVLEIHMAHGYLLHEFLSPLSNQRKDDYGGSLENRCRFPLAVAKEVRKAWPDDRPLFVRISATDWVDGGWDLDQSIVLSRELKKLGVDLIDVSSGGLVPYAKIPVGPSYQVPFAAALREKVSLATAAVGLITEAQQAEDILLKGEADAIFLARAMLRDPYWPLHAAQLLKADTPWPQQYSRAK